VLLLMYRESSARALAWRVVAFLLVFLIVLVLAASVEADASNPVAGVGAGAKPPERPNIIVILADDLGSGDLASFHPRGIETPNLSRLADEGIRLTDFHANAPVCSPTRASFLTGRYPQRAGITDVVSAYRWRNRHHGLHPEEVTLSALLRANGYQTGIVGKWHLGYQPEFRPLRHGFEFFRGFVSGNVDYITRVDPVGVFDWWSAEKTNPVLGYSTHLISRDAITFIKANKQRPFFLYVSHAAPHSPYQGPNDPPTRVVGNAHLSKGVEDKSRAYGEMVVEMDRGIGQLLNTLRRLDLEERTLVFFFSDNGANLRGSNRPYRGHKGSLWEGGHRVPAIAWWPGRLPAGVARTQTSMSIDLLPTILAVAGVSPPAGHVLDGIDLFPNLARGDALPERALFWDFDGFSAVRSGPWKLLLRPNGKVRLFDLDHDIGEKNDLSQKHPERVEKMKAAHLVWQREVEKGARVQRDAPESSRPEATKP
jgi:arylsulfatase A